MIYIYTGKVHTGKTTALRKWVHGKNNVGGFLTPDVEGLRVFYNIATGAQISFQQLQSEAEKTIEVGPYIFKKSIFDDGNALIEAQINDDQIDTIIIDELGKLEMKGEGFARTGVLIEKNYLKKKFIVVVRDYLVHEIAQKFNFPCYSIIYSTKFLV